MSKYKHHSKAPQKPKEKYEKWKCRLNKAASSFPSGLFAGAAAERDGERSPEKCWKSLARPVRAEPNWHRLSLLAAFNHMSDRWQRWSSAQMIDTNSKKKKMPQQPLVSKKGTVARLGSMSDSINPIPSIELQQCWRQQLLKWTDILVPQAELQVLHFTCLTRKEMRLKNDWFLLHSISLRFFVFL